jgi:hypothetical protein
MIEMFFSDSCMFSREIKIDVDEYDLLGIKLEHTNNYSSWTSIGVTPTFLIKRNSCGIIVSGNTIS